MTRERSVSNDPMVGDVILRLFQGPKNSRKALRLVVALAGETIFYVSQTGRLTHSSVTSWRKWARKAKIISLGEILDRKFLLIIEDAKYRVLPDYLPWIKLTKTGKG